MSDELEAQYTTDQAAQPAAGGSNGAATPDTNASPEPFLTVKRGGQTVALSREQAAEFASKGFDYERKTQDLARNREDLQPLLQLREQAKNDPKLQRALQAAIVDPERVLRAMQGANGQGHEPNEDNTPSAPGDDVQQILHRELEPVKKELAEYRSQRAVNTREQAIEQAMSSQEVLSGTKSARAFVAMQARAELDNDSSMSPVEAVGKATQLYYDAMKEHGKALIDKNTRQAPLRTQPPHQGVPPTAPPKQPRDHKRLGSGSIPAQISAELRKDPTLIQRMFGRRPE